MPVCLQVFEMRAFSCLTKESVPAPITLAVTLDRLNFSRLTPIVINTKLTNQQSGMKDRDAGHSDALDIVPFMPSLHAVLIKIWAEAQGENNIDNEAVYSDLNIMDQMSDETG